MLFQKRLGGHFGRFAAAVYNRLVLVDHFDAYALEAHVTAAIRRHVRRLVMERSKTARRRLAKAPVGFLVKGQVVVTFDAIDLTPVRIMIVGQIAAMLVIGCGLWIGAQNADADSNSQVFDGFLRISVTKRRMWIEDLLISSTKMQIFSPDANHFRLHGKNPMDFGD
uniref:Uncharacterized protein n=1 Tax=Romanomermis culicivorax TaxID=13658 RepID=A0A915HM83_ROMCU